MSSQTARDDPRICHLASLNPHWVIPSVAKLGGAKALRLVLTPDAQTPDNPTFAIIEGTDFRDGIIEVELAGRPQQDAGAFARGFIGVAFRIEPDLSAFECFYVRPTNGRAKDQLRRNRATQYFSYPDWSSIGFEMKRPANTSRTLIVPGAWTRLRIEVEGERARL